VWAIHLPFSALRYVQPTTQQQVTGIYRAVPIRVAPNRRSYKSVYKTYLDIIHIKKDEATRMRNEAAAEENATGPRANGKFVEDDRSEQFTPAQVRKNLDTSRLCAQGAIRRDFGLDSAACPRGGKRPDPRGGVCLLTSPFSQVERFKAIAADKNLYDVLVSSLAPSIWEMEDIKKGVLCLLFGGANQDGAGQNGKFRGEINVLLVGDPGVSKSQLLSYVNKIAPRGIYTSGRGSSAVGLTAYVTKVCERRPASLRPMFSSRARKSQCEGIHGESWQGNEIGTYLTLSCYIHLLMTYEHLTSRGDDSPKWTEIEYCNQPVYLL
jgi:DNA replication licensing factor MCM4